jgi:hypothetical protein
MNLRKFADTLDVRYLRSASWASAAKVVFGLAVCLVWAAVQGVAQTGGTGAIEGTVTDPSAAVVGGATVTATNTLTGVATVAVTTGTGHFVLPLLQPGPYNVTITAANFETLTQSNVIVDALATVSVSPKLTVGAASMSITVSSAPTMLNTDDVKLGSVIENDVYDALPLAMNASARDPTAFAGLSVGVESYSTQAAGPSTGSFNGGQTYQNETYVEGLPLTSAGTESDTRNLAFGISVEAVDQFQVATSGSESSYEGQGVSNYIVKSGTDKFHGGVYEYFRNTIFDARNFFSPTAATVLPGQPIVPIEHQNEFGGLIGGPIIKDKLFFFANYDGYRYDSDFAPVLQNIPTTAERGGDFSAFTAYPIYDPTTCLTMNAGGSCTSRKQFSYNGVANVIDPARVSNIAKSFESYLPTPSNNAITANYLATIPNLVSNDSGTLKVDYNISDKHRLYGVYSRGKYANPITGSMSAPSQTANMAAPGPYIDGRSVLEYATLAQIHEAYSVNPNMVNDFGFGLSRLWIPLISNTASGDYPSKAGLMGLPPGIASTGFPDITFSGNDVPISWDGTNSHANNEAQTTFTAQDNFLWTKGRHHMTFGFQWQALQDNDNNPLSGSQAGFTFSGSETANFNSSAAVNTSTGLAYASFLLGIPDSSVVTFNAVAETGGRYKTYSPYAQDDIQVSPKLTVNLGLRWDIWSPFTEAHNYMTFFNPNVMNSVVGLNGALQFAGHGTDSCNCSTPVMTHYHNFGPRVGIAYSLDSKTVVRSSYGIFYAHAGGVGGRTDGRQGLGQIGFDNSGSLASTVTGQGAYYTATDNGAWDNGYPGNPINPPFINPSYGIGNIASPGPNGPLNPLGIGPGTAQGLSYADPLQGGIAPQYQDWTLNIQRALSQNMTLSVAYSGSVGHHMPGAAVAGPFTNQIPAQYLPLGSLLTQTLVKSSCTAQGVCSPVLQPSILSQVQAIDPTFQVPFTNFVGTVAAALRPYPQYSGLSNPWLDVGNEAYHALQVSVNRRISSGLTFMANYTFSKEIDDLAGVRYPGADNLERSVGSIDHANVAQGTFVYKLPFGAGHLLGNSNPALRDVVGGWQFAGVYTASSGAPLTVTGTCTGGGIIDASCYPNYTVVGQPGTLHAGSPSGTPAPVWQGGSVWQNGRPHPGSSPTAFYLNSAAFIDPAAYNYGNAARTAPIHLFAPRIADTDLSVHKEIPIAESMKFLIQADVFDLTNSVYFSAPNTTLDSSSFGEITGQANLSRRWQFSARLTF